MNLPYLICIDIYTFKKKKNALELKVASFTPSHKIVMNYNESVLLFPDSTELCNCDNIKGTLDLLFLFFTKIMLSGNPGSQKRTIFFAKYDVAS